MEDARKQALADKLEKDEQALRDWRQSHWAEDSAIKYEEAAVSKKQRATDLKSQYDASITATYDEWADRDMARTRMQVEMPILSEPIDFPSGETLGVFGVPKHPGAFHAIEDGGFKPGVDQVDIHAFSSNPQTEYESNTVAVMESEAEVARSQGLYDMLTSESKHLDEAMDRICTLRDALERDYKQIHTEQRITDKGIGGPPRRLPSTIEQGTTHTRKSRMTQLQQEIVKYQHAIDQCEIKKRRVDVQVLDIAKKLAAARERSKADVNKVKDVNDGFGMLPVVVGRNITKIPGMDVTAKPSDTYSAITHQSKYISHHAQSLVALKVHREGVKLDREIWVERQGRHELKVDVEGTMNRLAHINNRLKNSRVEMNKLNVVEALNAFQQSGTILFNRSKRIAGPMCWWRNRNSDLCMGAEPFAAKNNSLGVITFDETGQKVVESESDSDASFLGTESDSSSSSGDSYSESDSDSEGEDTILDEDVEAYGVSLRAGKNSGFCMGTITLPKPIMWSVSFLVTRKGSDEKYAGPDKSDFVKVKLGYNLQNLKTIGIYYNKVNPENGGVLYDVKYLCSGDSLAYRFEFSSGSLNENHHLVVSAGAFEEYVVLPLETMDILNGRERVLSSYVKLLRLNEAQGKHRLTKLIEELLNAESSDLDGWDSEVVQNYAQRYKRDFFLRILRAEILVEREKSKREDDQPSDSSAMDNEKYMTEEEAEKTRRSEDRYVKRKQETQYHLISDARQMVGKRLDILDKETGRWRTVKVQNCLVNWVENGLRVLIQHTLQEVNKYNEDIGKQFIADLKLLHCVESPVQEVDKEAVAKLLEFRVSKMCSVVNVF